MRLRLTRKADADIAAILRTTKRLFGKNQVLTYAALISDGLTMIATDPLRPSCRSHNDLAAGIRSMHLDHVRGRSGSAAHLVFFVEKTAPDGVQEIVVIGVLHERMIPRRHLAKALRDVDDQGRQDNKTGPKQ